MRRLRERLSVLALALLLVQGSAVTLSALACCASKGQEAAAPMSCCKEGMSAPGQMCPMHHGQGATKSSGKRCALRNACSTDHSVLLSLFADVGLPAYTPVLHVHYAAPSPLMLTDAPIGRTVVPDPPPPRL